MKQEKINRAYPSLVKLKDLSLPVKKAYAVYKLYCAVEDAYNFALGEEKKYLSEFDGVVVGDGSINFNSADDCSAFKAKFDELINTEIELDIEAVTLSENDVEGQRLTPGDIYNLEGFVIFE